MSTLLLTGFVLGLTANFHCLGMCGPIAMAVPLNRKSNLHILAGALTYNGGRILTYSLLGVIVGSIGLTVNTIGFLQWMSIISGILLILLAWRKAIGRLLHGMAFPWLQHKVNRGMGKLLKSSHPLKLLPLGMLNGILPCGMVFAALLNAVLSGNPLEGALAMTAFGIGTLPVMLFVSFAANRIGNATRARLSSFVPYLLTAVGILVCLRGMNLDIPWISPKVQVVEEPQTGTEAGNPEPQVEMSCCHSGSSCEKD